MVSSRRCHRVSVNMVVSGRCRQCHCQCRRVGVGLVSALSVSSCWCPHVGMSVSGRYHRVGVIVSVLACLCRRIEVVSVVVLFGGAVVPGSLCWCHHVGVGLLVSCQCRLVVLMLMLSWQCR